MDDIVVTHRKHDGFAKVPIELITDTAVSAGAVRLYALLHTMHGQQRTYPRQDTLAKKLGVTPRTIYKWTAELEAANWVIAIERFDKNHKRKSHRYHVFEVQQECEEWRKRLEGKSGEKATGNAVPVGHRKSTSDRSAESHRKSTSDKTESIETDILTDGDDKPNHEGEEFRTIQTAAVEMVYGKDDPRGWGKAGQLAQWALCRPLKGAWADFPLSVPFTPIEWKAFLLFYEAKKINWPGHVEKWQNHARLFRASPDYPTWMARARRLDEPQESPDGVAQMSLMAAALEGAA